MIFIPKTTAIIVTQCLAGDAYASFLTTVEFKACELTPVVIVGKPSGLELQPQPGENPICWLARSKTIPKFVNTGIPKMAKLSGPDITKNWSNSYSH